MNRNALNELAIRALIYSKTQHRLIRNDSIHNSNLDSDFTANLAEIINRNYGENRIEELMKYGANYGHWVKDWEIRLLEDLRSDCSFSNKIECCALKILPNLKTNALAW